MEWKSIWLKRSIVSNAPLGTSIHNYELAIDYFLVSDDGNKSLWTVNEKWKRVAAIAKSVGFEWGGDWQSFKDYHHLALTTLFETGIKTSIMQPIDGDWLFGLI